MQALKISSLAICAAEERGIPASKGMYFSETALSSLTPPSADTVNGNPTPSISSYVGSRNSSTPALASQLVASLTLTT